MQYSLTLARARTELITPRNTVTEQPTSQIKTYKSTAIQVAAHMVGPLTCTHP